MSDTPTLAHITLTTGHSRQSPRSEVSDEILVVVEGLLAAAIDGAARSRGSRLGGPGRPAIPRVTPACHLTAAAEGDALIATVWADEAPGAPGTPAPLTTIGVAASDDGAARLWRLLHESATKAPGVPPLATDPGRPPAAPWCAARIDVGLLVLPRATQMAAMGWMGDFERCVGWAWIEMRRRKRGEGN